VSDRVRDVVVVGGGPAGAAAACLLARRGRDVLVLDGARFPRDKVCGDSVAPGAWRLLEAMGAAGRVRALAPRPLRGMEIVAPDGTVFRGEYPPGGPCGFALRRLDLDRALLDAARDAGAEVREGSRVTDLLGGRAGVEGVVVGTGGDARGLRARATVGADGRGSVVARRLGVLREHPRRRRFAVRGHWEGMAGLGELGEMHVGGGGYCGVAPLSPEGANVAFVLDRADLAGAAGRLESFYRETLRRRWPRIAARLEPAHLLAPPCAVGPLAVSCRAVAVPGAVLVGDAAGFYDPFTGDGVTLALRTGSLAAEAIDAALAAPGAAPVPRLRDYERAHREATRDKLRFERLLQLAVGWPAAANAVAGRLARRRDLADRLVGIAADLVPPRAVLAPRFLWGLLTAGDVRTPSG
jgi:menaquinone-9 beta-reductase